MHPKWRRQRSFSVHLSMQTERFMLLNLSLQITKPLRVDDKQVFNECVVNENYLGRHVGTVWWHNRNSETFLQHIDYNNLINSNWEYQLVCSLTQAPRICITIPITFNSFARHSAKRLYCDNKSQYVPIKNANEIIRALIYCISSVSFMSRSKKLIKVFISPVISLARCTSCHHINRAEEKAILHVTRLTEAPNLRSFLWPK